MKIDIFLSNQLKIARETLKMSDVGISIMGGMTRDEAIEILARHRNRNHYQKQNYNNNYNYNYY